MKKGMKPGTELAVVTRCFDHGTQADYIEDIRDAEPADVLAWLEDFGDDDLRAVGVYDVLAWLVKPGNEEARAKVACALAAEVSDGE